MIFIISTGISSDTVSAISMFNKSILGTMFNVKINMGFTMVNALLKSSTLCLKTVCH